jgi:hypothetical protein
LGCLTLREEYTLRVSEDNIWTQGKKLVGGWGGLHNEELHNLYASSNIIGVIESRRM